MPFDQATTAVNPGLAISGLETYKFGGDPVAMMEQAYKSGFVKVQDLLDAGIVRPAQRQAEKQTALDTAEAKQQSRDIRAAQRQNGLDIQLGLKTQSALSDTIGANQQVALDTIEKTQQGRDIRAAQRATGLDVQAGVDTQRTAADTARIGSTLSGAENRYITPGKADQIAATQGEAGLYKGTLDIKNAQNALDMLLKDPEKNKAGMVSALNAMGEQASLSDPTEVLVTKIGEKNAKLTEASQTWELAKIYAAHQNELKDKARALTTTLATDISGNKVVQAYDTALQNGTNLLKLAQQSPTGMVDLAMINQFNKVLDPTGTVREGEQKLTTSAISTLQRWGIPQGSIDEITNRFTLGTKLTADTRKSMADIVTLALKNHRALVQDSIAPVLTRAADMGIPASHILPQHLANDLAPEPSSAPGPASTPAPVAGQTETRKVFNPTTQKYDDVQGIWKESSPGGPLKLYRAAPASQTPQAATAPTKPVHSSTVVMAMQPGSAAAYVRTLPEPQQVALLNEIDQVDPSKAAKILNILHPDPAKATPEAGPITISPTAYQGASQQGLNIAPTP